MKKSKIAFVLVALVGGLLCAKIVRSANTDISALQGDGSLYNVDVFRITSTADMKLTDSASYTAFDVDSTLGTITLSSGSLNLSGSLGQPTTSIFGGITIALKNCGTAAWVQGNLITVDDDEAGCGTVSPTTVDLTDWVGISIGAVAVGDVGYVAVGGLTVALTTGTVNRGDTLVSTNTVAGYLGADATPTTGADVGVALSSGTSAGGLTLIRLR